MNQHDFESSVLHLWMTTRVPLTRANLQFYSKAPRGKLNRWLEAMVSDGVLDIDSDDEGEMIWSVRGAARPSEGPERVADLMKLGELSRAVEKSRNRSGQRGSAGRALSQSRGFVEQALARKGGQKNVLASGALSLLGPIGWLYAGPIREALPAALLYSVVWWLAVRLPFFLAAPIQGLLVTVSVIAGLLYAWQYNRNGEVTPLLDSDTDDGERRPRLPRLPGR